MGVEFTIGFGGSVKAVLTAVRQFKISALYIDANVFFFIARNMAFSATNGRDEAHICICGTLQ